MSPGGTSLDVLGMGTVAVDDFLHVATYPPADEKREILEQTRRCGGLIGTALAAAARLGARCAYIGLLGDDELSRFALRALRDAGVDVESVRLTPGAGPVHSTIIVDRRHGSRAIFYNRAGIRPYPAGWVEDGMLRRAPVLLVDQLGIEEKIPIARRARELGIPVVADMEWPDLDANAVFMPLVDHLILPFDFGRTITTRSGPEDMVAELHRRSPRACTVVTKGDEGCWYIEGRTLDEVRHQPAFAVRVVETTGCGDVFHGGYATALAFGCSVRVAVMRATAAAALYASRPSGWEHLPTEPEVRELLEGLDPAARAAPHPAAHRDPPSRAAP